MTRWTLSDTALSHALAAWDIPHPHAITRFPGGFTGDTWYVHTPTQRFVAKHAFDNQAAFERGLFAAEILERHGLRCGAPLRTTSNTVTTMIEGPPGLYHPLALLRFVPGAPLDWTTSEAPRIVGQWLGRVHAILRHEPVTASDQNSLFTYLTKITLEVAAHSGLQHLIDRAVRAVQTFESQTHVTYGTIYGDYMEFLCDPTTGQIGLIDWGTVRWGPLLFDIALVQQQFHGVGQQWQQQTDQFMQEYLREGPISLQEMVGAPYYLALHLAELAKFFAWRVAHNITQGDDEPDANQRSLVEIQQALEHTLESMSKD